MIGWLIAGAFAVLFILALYVIAGIVGRLPGLAHVYQRPQPPAAVPVVPPIRSPRPVAGGQGALTTAPRILEGVVVERDGR